MIEYNKTVFALNRFRQSFYDDKRMRMKIRKERWKKSVVNNFANTRDEHLL